MEKNEIKLQGNETFSAVLASILLWVIVPVALEFTGLNLLWMRYVDFQNDIFWDFKHLGLFTIRLKDQRQDIESAIFRFPA